MGQRLLLCAVIMVVLTVVPAYSYVFYLSDATGFQNEGTLTQNHFSLLSNLDGQWGPSTGGTVIYNYYATGTDSRWWDAISLNFDLSTIGWNNISMVTLRFYTQQGAYQNTSWHHYQVLQGAFNPSYQDNSPTGWTGLVNFGNHGSNGLVGWLEAPVPISWITTNNFDVTLRLWNARIDYIELQATVIPEPNTILLLGSALLGIGAVSFMKKRKSKLS
jgi:hypothetical protein